MCDGYVCVIAAFTAKSPWNGRDCMEPIEKKGVIMANRRRLDGYVDGINALQWKFSATNVPVR